MITHRDKKPYECHFQDCDKSYSDMRSLRRHLENHHGAQPSTAQHPSPSCGVPSPGTCSSGSAVSPHMLHPSSAEDRNNNRHESRKVDDALPDRPSSVPNSNVNILPASRTKARRRSNSCEESISVDVVDDEYSKKVPVSVERTELTVEKAVHPPFSRSPHQPPLSRSPHQPPSTSPRPPLSRSPHPPLAKSPRRSPKPEQVPYSRPSPRPNLEKLEDRLKVPEKESPRHGEPEISANDRSGGNRSSPDDSTGQQWPTSHPHPFAGGFGGQPFHWKGSQYMQGIPPGQSGIGPGGIPFFMGFRQPFPQFYPPGYYPGTPSESVGSSSSEPSSKKSKNDTSGTQFSVPPGFTNPLQMFGAGISAQQRFITPEMLLQHGASYFPGASQASLRTATDAAAIAVAAAKDGSMYWRDGMCNVHPASAQWQNVSYSLFSFFLFFIDH